MDFAEKIRKEKEGETKFNFLNPSNPYHAFFLHKVEDFKSGGGNWSFYISYLLAPTAVAKKEGDVVVSDTDAVLFPVVPHTPIVCRH
jgi:hypothetical protein